VLLNERGDLIHLRIKKGAGEAGAYRAEYTQEDTEKCVLAMVDIYDGKDKEETKVKEMTIAGDYIAFKRLTEELKIYVLEFKRNIIRELDLSQFVSSEKEKVPIVATINACDP